MYALSHSRYDVIKIVGTVPLNDASTLRQRQRSMSSERGDEGEGAEGMESLEEPLRQSKPSLRRESRPGTTCADLRRSREVSGRLLGRSELTVTPRRLSIFPPRSAFIVHPDDIYLSNNRYSIALF